MPIKRALISVSDKTGLVEFAKKLADKNIEIISTGGTAKLLKDNGIKVIEVSDYTGTPEMMAGRVKTLNAKIHGGILARRGVDDEVMKTHNIKPIDLLIVNLYPFAETIKNPDCKMQDAIENIDIGGPAMLRSAAKNYEFVTVIVDNSDYQNVLDEIIKSSETSLKTRARLAQKVFAHTSHYDSLIADYLSPKSDGFADTLNLKFNKAKSLRYGENPHQKAAFYVEQNPPAGSISAASQLQGKELSFNNVADADAAIFCVGEFLEPACVIIKHANPCGVAVRGDIYAAYLEAFKTDPSSAFGGIIALNRPLDKKTATAIIRQFVEVIIAPSVDDDAKKVLATKQNIRVLECGNLTNKTPALDYKKVGGGLLVQDQDLELTAGEPKCPTKISPTKDQIKDLMFAWTVAKSVKSNAIVYAKNQATIGIGAGQMSRVYSAKIAGIKAADEGLELDGAVMASDAFFPFRDSVDAAAKVGIKAIIQPGGSIRDNEVVDAANEHNIAMFFTSMRHFKH